MIEVLRPGPLSTIQDYGRPGWAHLGVPRSGAADLRSLALANRLVGNESHCAAIEVTMGGAAFRFTASTAFVLAGADARALHDERPFEHGRRAHASAGDTLELRTPLTGVRTYLAVAGGVAVPPVLGSRSTDTLSALGPSPLKAGDLLPIGIAGARAADFPDFTLPPSCADPLTVRYTLGPREEFFGPAGLDILDTALWSVTADSNRVGVRLNGPAIESAGAQSVPSEGMVLGSIEIPPGGRPIVLLADHPATGGYPVIGVLDSDSVCDLAQARPGGTVRFTRR